MRWREILNIAFGLLQWTIAILAVVGTLALLGWIVMMVVKKDKPE